MQMFYTNNNGTVIQYTIQTDPLEAMYWTTYRLKVEHIKIITKLDRQTMTKVRREIFNDIISREPNPTKAKN